MTMDQFYMFSKAARSVERDDTRRMINAMRLAMGADEKQFKQIMKELESQ